MRSYLLAALLLVGCAENPADKAPAAVVGTSTPSAVAATATPGATATPMAVAGKPYIIEPGTSKVEWVGSKVTGRHDGGFKEFHGMVGVVDNDPEKSTVQIEIDATSIYADDEKLTGHLKSKDFFEVETYPTATFKSTQIKKDGDKYTISGDLTMHGQTKQISFPATIQVADDRVKADAEFSIKRMDFGIVYKGKADNLIRDEVVMKLNIDAKPSAS